jgi:hypothetical protein
VNVKNKHSLYEFAGSWVANVKSAPLGQGQGSRRLGIQITRKFGTASSARASGSMELAVFWRKCGRIFMSKYFKKPLFHKAFLNFLNADFFADVAGELQQSQGTLL